MAQPMSVLRIDVAQWVLHVVGMDDTGAVVLRKRLARSDWLALMANLPPLRIGMEACGSAHDWTRCVREHGHAVRLIAPRMVKKSKSACIYTDIEHPMREKFDKDSKLVLQTSGGF